MTREQDDQEFFAEMDKLSGESPYYFAGAFQGMLFGFAVGFVLDNKRAGGGGYRRLAKFAAIGAGVSVATQVLAHSALKGMNRFAHAHSPYPPPATPIVTKGAFAGSPRPLYPAHDSRGVSK